MSKKASEKPMGKILIVEDDKHTSQLLSLNLEREGYEVLTAYDGEAGVQTAKAELPDVIMLDLLLPHVDGWEVCRRLREEGSPTRLIPIIIVSVMAQDDMPDKKSMGPVSFFNKPFRVGSLMEEVGRLVGIAHGSRS